MPSRSCDVHALNILSNSLNMNTAFIVTLVCLVATATALNCYVGVAGVKIDTDCTLGTFLNITECSS